MRKACFGWVRRHPFYSGLIVFACGFAALNAMAYQHARAMIWFVPDGLKTRPPRELSLLDKARVLMTGVRVPRPANDGTPADHHLESAIRLVPVDDDIHLETWWIPAEAPVGTVILFHGYAGSKSDLLPEAEFFHDLAFDVRLVDFRGSGGSTENYTTMGYLEADDVAEVVKDARAEAPALPLILYGRSMGAAAILRAIHVHGVKADAVVLESTFDRMLTTARNRFHQMGLPAFPSANLLVYWGGVSAGFDAHRHNPVDYAPSCECPTLLLHGELDVHARPEEGRNVRSRLGDSAAELVIFPEAGHMPLLAADPQRWRSAMQRLLNRLRNERAR